MYCLKCGNSTENEQVFCDHCLKIMAGYPVKPGINVHLPRKNPLPVQKKQSRRRILSSDEQLLRMRVTVRILTVLLCVSLLVLGISLYYNFLPRTPEASIPQESIGQNYSIDPTLE